MSRLPTRIAPLAVPLCLILPLVGLGAEPPLDELPAHQKIEGRRVTKYTKVWSDDYHNYHKDIYQAYTKTLKDEQGQEVRTEIWHGKATSFHKNGNKSWEVEYRDGMREGVFRSWADNGVQIGQANFQHGLLHGQHIQWDRDGHKMLEQTYEKGKLNGEAREWDKDSNLLATGVYRDGKPWAGTFSELVTPPDDSSYTVIRRYEDGKKVCEKRLKGN